MLPIEAYLAERTEQSGRFAMHQHWRDLLFLHFSCDPADIQPFLPSGMTVDTFPDSAGVERAWVGLVCFRMFGIRPPYAPAAPWLSAFPETNVRTYVHREGVNPGVWFLSLDAARFLACVYARLQFALPYRHAFMSVDRVGDSIHYYSVRREQPTPADLDIRCELENERDLPEPGSLDFFLVERYRLYAQRSGRLLTGCVAHVPYPLRSASLASCEQSLVRVLGIEQRPWEHVAFSEGVDVKVWPLTS